MWGTKLLLLLGCLLGVFIWSLIDDTVPMWIVGCCAFIVLSYVKYSIRRSREDEDET